MYTLYSSTMYKIFQSLPFATINEPLKSKCREIDDIVGKFQIPLFLCTYGYDILTHDLDINECDKDNGSCSQICTNTERSYECSCRNGYVLDSDGHNCSGTHI